MNTLNLNHKNQVLNYVSSSLKSFKAHSYFGSQGNFEFQALLIFYLLKMIDFQVDSITMQNLLFLKNLRLWPLLKLVLNL